jgi:glycosyltransferase involved in cell wall biosynthesis
MLIGIDASRAAAGQPTGTESYSLQLIRALLEVESTHQLRLYLNRPGNDLFPRAANAELRHIPFPRLWTHARLAAELASHRVDLLLVPSHVLPVFFPGRAVAVVHDLGYLRFPQAHRMVDRWYLNLSTRWNTRRAAVIIADSEATRRDLVLHCGARPDRIEVVYPGIDTNLRPVRDRARLDEVRTRYGIQADYMLYLGTLQPRKNLARLLDAYAQLDPEAVQLVLAGKPGWLSGPILSRAQEVGAVLPGYIRDQDKAALLSGAVAFLFPSLYEGFGFPVLEAMACGTPVICSNTSSLPEVAGQAALQVDPLDTTALMEAMRRILSDKPLAETLVQSGFVNLERFSWHSCARQVLELCERAAE